MTLKKIFLILLIINLTPLIGKNTSFRFILHSQVSEIYLLDVNSKLYISINDLSKIFNTIDVQNGYKLVLNNESLKFAAGSNYVVYDNKNKLRVAQMTLKCILKNNDLYIPCYEFLNSMKEIDILNYDLRNETFYIYTEIFKIKKNDNTLNSNFIDKSSYSDTVKTSNKDISNQQSLDTLPNNSDNSLENKLIIDSLKQPLKYIIPKGLVK